MQKKDRNCAVTRDECASFESSFDRSERIGVYHKGGKHLSIEAGKSILSGAGWDGMGNIRDVGFWG